MHGEVGGPNTLSSFHIFTQGKLLNALFDHPWLIVESQNSLDILSLFIVFCVYLFIFKLILKREERVRRK